MLMFSIARPVIVGLGYSNDAEDSSAVALLKKEASNKKLIVPAERI